MTLYANNSFMRRPLNTPRRPEAWAEQCAISWLQVTRPRAFGLLNKMVIEDFARNPSRVSALDLDEVQPEMFAGRPEILVPLASDLVLRGAFERGERAFVLADQVDVDYQRDPELAVRQELLRAFYKQVVGRLEESMAHVVKAREIANGAVEDEYLLVAMDTVEMYDRSYLFEFTRARHLIDAVSAARVVPPPVRDVLCPGAKSQVAFFEGALGEAADLSGRALASARRLGIEEQYFAFVATRTSALLALERRDLSTAARTNERVLGTQAVGRPVFDYFAQLDRARIWAAGGDLDQALGSLPAARAALRSENSPLLAEADELEARFRSALGDRGGAAGVAERLTDERRQVVLAVIALAAGDTGAAAAALSQRARDRADNTFRPGIEPLAGGRGPGWVVGSRRPTGERGAWPGRKVRVPPDGARYRPGGRRPSDLRLRPLPRLRLCKRFGRRRATGSKARRARSQQRRAGRSAHGRRTPGAGKAAATSDLCRHGVRTALVPQHREDAPAAHVHETGCRLAFVRRKKSDFLRSFVARSFVVPVFCRSRPDATAVSRASAFQFLSWPLL